MNGFAPLLRLALRDLRRNPGRSLVVFLMILLPVLGVAGASTVIATAQVDMAEVTPRVMGTADVTVAAGAYNEATPKPATALDRLEPHVRSVLGDGTRTTREISGPVRASSDKGAVHVRATEADLRNPLLTGTFRLDEGHLPRSVDEVVVNGVLARYGPGIGEKLEVRDGPTRRVVGIVQDMTYGEASAWGMPGSLIADPRAPGALEEVRVFAASPRPLGYDDPSSVVLRNELARGGYDVQNRQDGGSMYADDSFNGISGADLAVFVLIVVMAVTEVVLLAGPAFAVTARRRQRELALVAANGGTPRQVRSAVLASALVIGGLAAVVGAVGGVLGGWAVAPFVEGFGDSWFGPRDWSLVQVAGVAAFGLLSAVLAALVPAWIASRQDVVRVLAGRRGDPAPARFSPVLGVVLMLLGVALTAIGVAGEGYGEIWIGFGSVATVLGAVALMPMLLVGVARLLGRSPLVVRYALRDGLRHRTRTVPAIGAVMATVAGVVALGIANSSAEAAGEAAYQPQAPLGHGSIRVWSDTPDGSTLAEDWQAVVPKVLAIAPDAVVATGLVGANGDDPHGVDLVNGGEVLSIDTRGPYDYGIAVGTTVHGLDLGLDAADERRADAVLAKGGVVAFANPADGAGQATSLTVRAAQGDPDDPASAGKPARTIDVPAVVFETDEPAAASAVLAPAVVERLGLHAGTSAMLLNRYVSPDEEEAIEQAFYDVVDGGEVYVERGYQPDPGFAIVMLVLAVVGVLLMVGGTLTATVLALADAGPDLATLSAVGAAPRTSRAVAMGIAFVIGGVGAALGVVVGAVPGIAATWPLTAHSYYYGSSGGQHVIDVPWLLLGGIAVGVPVLLALAVGLCARSRLPLVARIE